jgi:hypothetical protein
MAFTCGFTSIVVLTRAGYSLRIGSQDYHGWAWSWYETLRALTWDGHPRRPPSYVVGRLPARTLGSKPGDARVRKLRHLHGQSTSAQASAGTSMSASSDEIRTS